MLSVISVSAHWPTQPYLQLDHTQTIICTKTKKEKLSDKWSVTSFLKPSSKTLKLKIQNNFLYIILKQDRCTKNFKPSAFDLTSVSGAIYRGLKPHISEISVFLQKSWMIKKYRHILLDNVNYFKVRNYQGIANLYKIC